MDRRTALLIANLAIALCVAAGLFALGTKAQLAIAVGAVWCGTMLLFYFGSPQAPPTDREGDRRAAVREAIESLGQPMLVVDGTRIEIANAAARTALGGHVVGQDARIALRRPEAIALLSAEDGASAIIPGFTGGRSLWQLTRRRLDGRRWLIELVDRTLEADIGRAHTDFVANASHELRTPLASVIGYVETLADGGDDVPAETRTRFLLTVLRESKRMLSLVEDLMALSLVEAEKHDRPTEQVDLANLAARVGAEIAAVRNESRIEVTAAERALFVLGDPRQLDQLLRNLIDNALKYGEAGTPVAVRVDRDAAGSPRLTVADRGPGVAAEFIPHLTRRFYRTDPGRSRASGGTGLGLAIVKHIVERHAGRLDIASTLGEGTVVTVTFPAIQQTALT